MTSHLHSLMVRRTTQSFVLLFILACPGWASVELMPMIGYQFTTGIGLAGPRYERLNIEDNPLYGVAIGYTNDQLGQLELAWTHSRTSATIDRSGGGTDRFDVDMDRLMIHAIMNGEGRGFIPFGLLGAGATRFSPSGPRSTTTRFTFAIGGGTKWMWTDSVGFRFDAKWMPSLALNGSHYFCDRSGTQECYSRRTTSSLGKAYPFLNSFEFTSGLVLRY